MDKFKNEEHVDERIYDPSDYGYVVPKGSILHEQTPDEKARILAKVGDDYNNDGPVRQKRTSEPFDLDAYHESQKQFGE